MASDGGKFVPYEERAEWSDLEPIPQNDGENPMVPIAYAVEYRSGMNMFRALVKKGEHSERGLKLTYDIIRLNPGHYSVWAYRGETLKAIRTSDELERELEVLDDLVKAFLKTYQIWQHRRNIVTVMPSEAGAHREIQFTTRALKLDAKNYHTWAYRQWALCYFWGPDAVYKANEEEKKNTWKGELAYTETLLNEDIRNNSAWNHRFFVVFESGYGGDSGSTEREIEFAKDKVTRAPHNASAWNYLRGVLERTGAPADKVTEFARGLEQNGEKPFLAVEFLADHAKAPEAEKMYDELAGQLDPIRRPYWAAQKQAAAQR